ncbi:DNA adenine methylase Dam [Paraburkholderia sp. BL6665CI2N2]|uniref:DNA adenine methylase n=1 Tax=Paraburkholderia sp. BL6665CI2N2 TaxID=1938806 RepID=UPI001065944C|nr:Dam family site-specific DNA-(adenine-N6)-methyltransferase [Paraburkholderia sp. BL6665CI2N2]TDY22114.1 DNA adenine methylase Dam [Paraburkholderia sp. BL6665CI2N2]
MQTHPTSKNARLTKPFLKWAGGKSRILQHIVSRLPPGRRLIEPFVGGGSVFLGTDYEQYLLGDNNGHLVELYQAVSQRPDEFVELASGYFDERFCTPEQYLAIRAAFNLEQDALRRAAQFLYLNKFGFNGLCRYNRSGAFNVPFGHLQRAPRFPLEQIVAFAEKARRAVFVNCDFAEVMASAVPGDICYCDPPYLDRDVGRSFTAYGPGGFAMQRQLELVSVAKQLAARGVPVLISNHDCVAARQIYADAKIITFTAHRSISAAADKRGGR